MSLGMYHRNFDEAVDHYLVANGPPYDAAMHLEAVELVVKEGQKLIDTYKACSNVH